MMQPITPMKKNGFLFLDPSDTEQVRAAADLTLTLFGKSPAAVLGREFLEQIYFSRMVKDGLIGAMLYRYEGKYVAFGVYTNQPKNFLGIGMKRYFFRLVFLVSKLILLKPSRIFAITNVLFQKFYRAKKAFPENLGELLTFGVLSDYRHLREGDQKVAPFLFAKAMQTLKSDGCEQMQLVCLKENSKAQQFFRSWGAVEDSEGYCFGDSTVLRFSLSDGISL